MAYKNGYYPFFTYTEDEKNEIRQELGLKENVIQDDIDAIIEWFTKQPHLIVAGVPDRDFLEVMLICAKGSREKTKKRIDNFFKYRSRAPELFEDTSEFVKSDKPFNVYYHYTCPKLYDLKRVSIAQFLDPDPNNVDMLTFMKTSMMIADLRLKYDYFLGDIWILDLTKVGFGHLLRVNPLMMQKGVQIFQDGMGFKIFSIHVLGASNLLQQVVQFFKRFVKQKIIDKVLFHSSIEDVYQYVPIKYLPSDYGGEMPSMADRTQQYLKTLRTEETKQFLLKRNQLMSDESRRSDPSIHEEYVAGSFKKLNLD